MSGVRELIAAAFGEAREREDRFKAARKLSGTVVTPLTGRPQAAASADRKPNRPPAASRDPCFQCGVPGFRGCEHQAPFEPAPHQSRALHTELRRR